MSELPGMWDPSDFTGGETDMEKLELDVTEKATGERPAVRRDCAFCHRERSKQDDNHAPDCPYWDFFG